MATYLGLGQALKVMRSDISRGGLHGWKKDSLVDALVSLAFAARAIPGILGHLEAACDLARASPSHGGGIDAAIRQLKDATWHPSLVANDGDSGDVGDSVATQESSDDTLPVNSDSSGDTVVGAAADGGDNTRNTQPTVATTPVPICRSLWKGRPCEDPTTCKRTHKPLCAKEACKSARDSSCQDWHYIPKKKRFSKSATTQKHAGGGSGNAGRGSAAPRSKLAKSESTRRMSPATEKLYYKWKLSEIKLQQSRMTAATYKDILMSNSQPSMSRQVGTLPVKPNKSVLAPPLAPPVTVAKSMAPTTTVNLGPIVSQLEAIVHALTEAGIMTNLQCNQN